MSVFLRLTDYVSPAHLCHLSAAELHLLVCGKDGTQLETVQRDSRAQSVRFVSAPVPGFHIEASSNTFVQLAVVGVEEILSTINTAALVASGSSGASSASTGADSAASSAHRINNGKQRRSEQNYYHPLHSNTQYIAVPKSPRGLLPLPGSAIAVKNTGDDEDDDGLGPPIAMGRQLSPEECAQLISSPYLSCARRRLAAAAPSPVLTSTASPFDTELAGCLPGVPGVRQSKEYKRIRRKITGIDELMDSNSLDACQRAKIGRRAEYVAQLRHMLLHGVQVDTPVVPQVDESRESIEVETPVMTRLQTPTAEEVIAPAPVSLPRVSSKPKVVSNRKIHHQPSQKATNTKPTTVHITPIKETPPSANLVEVPHPATTSGLPSTPNKELTSSRQPVYWLVYEFIAAGVSNVANAWAAFFIGGGTDSLS